ncbi:small ribosomal subunit protein mS39 [Osmerus mordax]|uniref:small ribosomal subunit protein mS39 n=1 Tax=Osmerus mordax TaxID=8014 RepID=UPI00350EA876
MAAPGKHVGYYIHRNSRVILTNLEQLYINRNFSWSAAGCQQSASSQTVSSEDIVIPKKKTWSKEAVLQALASTVNRDPTAPHYMFQDDPYLTPRNSGEFRLYSLSQEAGRAAAKYFVNTHPKFFKKEFAEPHIPCLMPESLEPVLEEVSEAALVERISLRKVRAAVDMYDQLLQAGTAVSLGVTNDLLDLISFYCDRNPAQDDKPDTEETEEVPDGGWKKRGKMRKPSDPVQLVWRENNNAERIFSLLPEKDSRSYCALIKGMVKHGAHSKAFNMYTELLNNRLTADIHTFNGLISAAPFVKEKYNDKWDLVVELLKQMSYQKIQPNLLMFNTTLKALAYCGPLSRAQAMPLLSEMKAMGIAPSLATFKHLLRIFHKAALTSRAKSNMLHDVMAEVSGKSFVCQDPEDVYFFSQAMKICLDTKDIEMGYQVYNLSQTGENWRLLGDTYHQSIFYGRFFSLLCLMEHIDVVLKWYKELIPSLYYPNPQGMMDLLQALDTDGRLDLIPLVWKDIRRLGHDNKSTVVEEVLTLMARDKHSPEVQEAFAACALDVKAVYQQGNRGQEVLTWSVSALTDVTSLLLAAHNTQQAWDMLTLFKTKNRVPPKELLDNFLSSCRGDGGSEKAVKLVKLSADFCHPSTPGLAARVLQEFELTDEQRAAVSQFEVAAEVSN